MPPPPPASFRFDGSFDGESFVFSMTRAYDTVNPGGEAVLAVSSPAGHDHARYWHHERLLCGAPVVRTDIQVQYYSGLGRGMTVAAGGLDSDSATPVILVHLPDPGKLLIRAFTSSGNVDTVKSLAWGGGQSLLADEPDAPTDTLYSPPFSFTICHGLFVAVCAVYENGTSIATAVCTLDRAVSNHWKLRGQGEDIQKDTMRGAYFQQPGYRVLPGGVVSGVVRSAIFSWANYVNNGSDQNDDHIVKYSENGTLGLAASSRSGVGQVWSFGQCAEVYTTPDRVVTSATTAQGQHAHTAYVEPFGASGLRLVAAIGDAWSHNRVITLTREDVTYYDLDGWKVNDDLHGSDLTSTDVDHPGTVGEGNQFVGAAQIGGVDSTSGQIIGSDEMTVPLCRLRFPSGTGDESRLNFTRISGVPPCSFWRERSDRPNYTWNTFFIASSGAEVGGPYAANICPGSLKIMGSSTAYSWQDEDGAARISLSIDGFTFGQCWAPNETAAGRPVAIAGGRIFLGGSKGPTGATGIQAGYDFGVRSIPIPAVRAQKPLCVGKGGTNLMYNSSDQLQLSLVSGTSQMTDAPHLLTSTEAAALPVKPPCLGPIYRCRSDATDSGKKRVGIWRLTADGAVNPSGNSAAGQRVKVKGWLCVLPYKSSVSNANTEWTEANCLLLAAALGRVSPIPTGDNLISFFATSREEVTVGPLQIVGDPGTIETPVSENQRRGWVPFTFDTDTDVWRSDANSGSGPTSAFALGLRLAAGAENVGANRFAFLIAFDSVVAGDTDYPDVPAPLDQRVFADEVGVVAGFECLDAWTIRLGGELSESGADRMIPMTSGLSAPSHRTNAPIMATLWESGTKHIRIRANFLNDSLDFLFTDGSNTATITVTGKVSTLTADHTDVTPHRVHDRFFYLRGSPIQLAVTKNGSVYTCYATVGGTEVANASATLTSITVKPTSIKFGDASGSNTESMYWYGGNVDSGVAATGSEVEASLQDLTYLDNTDN